MDMFVLLGRARKHILKTFPKTQKDFLSNHYSQGFRTSCWGPYTINTVVVFFMVFSRSFSGTLLAGNILGSRLGAWVVSSGGISTKVASVEVVLSSMTI